MKDSWQILSVPQFEDARGTLVPFELDESFPFDVKRVYLVTGKQNVTRGAHAHIVEEEVFVCVNGRVKMTVNDKQQETDIWLDTPTKAVYVPTQCWHEFSEFSDDAILLCFSSTHYLPGEQNYITNKQEFLKQ
ncbi:dTDP-6-deoxy-3,4-keto-hexulose isomerase [bacterium DOLZORAL124_38_8]|nr:MAG: dTDP-6-deoxy-3,4-keto-hexulose isomerase [bacterium DOLZORAL124_38_8]